MLIALACAVVLGGCGCSDTGLLGSPDYGTDPGFESTWDIDVDPSTDPVDTSTDPGFEPTVCDRDGDGWDSPECGGTDCNDDDPLIHPGAVDVCEDGIDQDCDGSDAIEGSRGDNLVVADIDEEGTLLTHLVWTGSDFAFFWRNTRSDSIYLNRIDAAGTGVSEEIAVRESESAYDVEWTGSTFGTVWCEETDSSIDLYYQLVDAGGAPLTEEVRVIDSGDVAFSGGLMYGPKILLAAPYFIILFVDDRYRGDHRLYFTRIASDGSRLLEDVEIARHDPEVWNGFNATWTGSEVGIVWASKFDTSPVEQLHFSRVDINGTHLSETVELTTDARAYQVPQVLWLGTEYGIFWHENVPGSDGQEIFLSRRSPDGSEMSRTTPFADIEDLYVFDLRAVWTGSSYALLWSTNSLEYPGTYLQRVGLTGDPIEPRIPISSESVREPHLVWTGAELGVSWKVFPSVTNQVALFNRVGFCDG